MSDLARAYLKQARSDFMVFEHLLASVQSSEMTVLDYQNPRYDKRRRFWIPKRWIAFMLVLYLVAEVMSPPNHLSMRGTTAEKLQVHVVDAGTGMPLASAAVRASSPIPNPSASAVTDQRGVAEVEARFGYGETRKLFTACERYWGVGSITASAPGYVPSNAPVRSYQRYSFLFLGWSSKDGVEISLQRIPTTSDAAAK